MEVAMIIDIVIVVIVTVVVGFLSWIFQDEAEFIRNGGRERE